MPVALVIYLVGYLLIPMAIRFCEHLAGKPEDERIQVHEAAVIAMVWPPLVMAAAMVGVVWVLFKWAPERAAEEVESLADRYGEWQERRRREPEDVDRMPIPSGPGRKKV
jgi:hypothetical protein